MWARAMLLEKVTPPVPMRRSARNCSSQAIHKAQLSSAQLCELCAKNGRRSYFVLRKCHCCAIQHMHDPTSHRVRPHQNAVDRPEAISKGTMGHDCKPQSTVIDIMNNVNVL